jgi:hypothetical protein
MYLLGQLLHHDEPEPCGQDGPDPSRQSIEQKPYVPDQRHAGSSRELLPRGPTSSHPSRGRYLAVCHA